MNIGIMCTRSGWGLSVEIDQLWGFFFFFVRETEFENLRFSDRILFQALNRLSGRFRPPYCSWHIQHRFFERSVCVFFSSAANVLGGSRGVINFPWIFYAMRSLVSVGHFRNISGHLFTWLSGSLFAGLFSDAMGYCYRLYRVRWQGQSDWF